MAENKTHKPWKKRKKKPNLIAIVKTNKILRTQSKQKLKEELLKGLKDGCMILSDGVEVEFVRRNV